MRLLSESDVSRLLDPDESIRASREAFVALSDGEAEIPLRTEIKRPEVGGVIMVMPGLIRGKNFGLKVIASSRETGTGNLLTTSLVLIFDSETLEPLGLLSSDYFTDYRTAAGLAAATAELARKDSVTHAVFGAGKLAGPSIALISRVRPIERLIIIGRTRKRVEELAEKVSADKRLNIKKIDVDLSADVAAEAADIITAVTSATEPVCDGRRIRPGTHINIGGAFQPTWREMDDAVAARGYFYMDSSESCLVRAGDICIPLASGVLTKNRLRGEIGSLMAGKIPGRASDAEITVFKSLGNAAQDLVLGSKLIRNSEKFGTRFDLVT